jgi:hypothetical protein
MDNMQAHVPARLAKNLKLHRELQSGAQNAWLKDGGGLYQPAGSIHFDGQKLGELLKYIARGLTWHHWGTYVSPDHKMRVMFSPDILSLYFQEQFEDGNGRAQSHYRSWSRNGALRRSASGRTATAYILGTGPEAHESVFPSTVGMPPLAAVITVSSLEG